MEKKYLRSESKEALQKHESQSSKSIYISTSSLIIFDK